MKIVEPRSLELIPLIIHTCVDVGAVLTLKVEGFTTRSRKPIRRGGRIVLEGFSCVELQGQARPSRQGYDLSSQVKPYHPCKRMMKE